MECAVERCLHLPDLEICEKVTECLPEPQCDGRYTYLKPECKCLSEDEREECDTVKKCEWGYKIGKDIVDLT